MSNQEYAPNGVSFAQIKKYAKRLKKESDLTSQQALNQKTKELTDFNCWEELVEYNKKRGGSLSKIKQGEKTCVIYADKPVYLLDFVLGSGAKSLILTTHKKMLYITTERIVPSVKKNIENFGLDHDKVKIQTINDIHKNGINKDDFDMIVLDEFHLTSISSGVMEKCYKFAIENKIFVYQFFNDNVFNLLSNPRHKTNYLKKYIANEELLIDNFYSNVKNRPYELFDYQKTAIKKLEEKMKSFNSK